MHTIGKKVLAIIAIVAIVGMTILPYFIGYGF